MTDSAITEHRPDVLECLVNLSNDEVFTPPEIANEVLDLLPAEIWQDKNAKFLDPCCKSGVFLREIAIRLNEGLKEQIPNSKERKLHIFGNQVYGIAITEFTAFISRRTVYHSRLAHGDKSNVKELFSDERGNIMYDITEHNWDNRGKCIDCGASEDQFGDKEQEGHAYQFIHTGIPKRFEDMEFDVIIGNPPYHMNTTVETSQAAPLYNKFINQAKKMNPKYISMIIPSRWYAGGMGLSNFRREMLDDRRISHLVDYPVSKECFPNNEVKGGICYFLWDRKHSDDCNFSSVRDGDKSKPTKRKLNEHDKVFIRDAQAIEILKKVQSHKEESITKLMNSGSAFGLRTCFRDKENPFKNSIEVHQTHSTGYTDIKKITKNIDWIEKHKALISKAHGGSEQIPHSIISSPIYAKPNSVCTETYIVAGAFKSRKEAENAISYIKTRFFRLLVSLKKNTQHAARKVYEFVPIQDFSKAWTDEDLYKKYKLTKEEKKYIEKMIKLMD